jgi:hypothetical protein
VVKDAQTIIFGLSLSRHHFPDSNATLAYCAQAQYMVVMVVEKKRKLKMNKRPFLVEAMELDRGSVRQERRLEKAPWMAGNVCVK